MKIAVSDPTTLKGLTQVVIPASLEEQPRVVDLLGDKETLGRLRRAHQAFGEALREERMSREIDSFDH